MHWPFTAALFASLAVLSGCRSERADRAGHFDFTDGLGRRLTLAEAPSRIISFAPSLTEMAYALGGDEKLVGVTAWCDYPPQARSKPEVGDYTSPNWERMAALKPDLVLMVGSADSPMLPRLEALGIPAAVFRSEGVEDVLGDMEALGRILDRGPESRRMVARLRRETDSLRAAADLLPMAGRPRVFAEIADRPLMTGSGRSFLGQLITLAGGINVAGDMLQDYAAVNPEDIIIKKPDIILVLHPGTTAEEVRGRIGWSTVPAVKKSRIVTGLDLNLLMRPGPRFPQAAKALFEVFHGQR